MARPGSGTVVGRRCKRSDAAGRGEEKDEQMLTEDTNDMDKDKGKRRGNEARVENRGKNRKSRRK